MKPKIALCVVLCFLFSSCATLFKGTTEEVSMRSDPARARIIVNGQDMGETPLSLKLEVKKSYDIVFQKEGFKSKTVHIANHIGAGWIVLDVLAGLVPVVIDAATGAWYSLDQKNVDVILDKQQPR